MKKTQLTREDYKIFDGEYQCKCQNYNLFLIHTEALLYVFLIAIITYGDDGMCHLL